MTVIVEFTVPADLFVLGGLLRRGGDLRITLERIVPTGAEVMPYFWVQLGDEDRATFEESVRNDPLVHRLEALDRHGDETLYSVEWESVPESLLDGIVQAQGAILRGGSAGDHWKFLVRFPDHDHITAFHEYLSDHDILVDVERVYTPSGDDLHLHGFGLTDEQRETLVAAVRQGYFEVPRRVTATDIAAELDITHQAVSERIRRATNTVLRTVLFGGWDGSTGADAETDHDDAR